MVYVLCLDTKVDTKYITDGLIDINNVNIMGVYDSLQRCKEEAVQWVIACEANVGNSTPQTITYIVPERVQGHNGNYRDFSAYSVLENEAASYHAGDRVRFTVYTSID